MRKIFMLGCAAIAASGIFAAPSGEEQAARQARSVHLMWKGLDREAREVRGTVKVTESQTNSYFMVIGFNGGYFGLQDVHGFPVGIFSVWDPVGHANDEKARADQVPENLRAKVLYSDPNVHVTRFGGEGTGAKTMFGCSWRTGVPVGFRVTADADGADRTAYTGYIGDGTNEFKIATISVLNHGVKPKLAGVYSFVEDFWRNGHSKTVSRRAEFTRFASRGPDRADETWHPASGACFTADNNTLKSIDAGPVPGGAFLQTGGGTKNVTVPLWSDFPVGK